jgi:hypothetical protein
MFNFKNELNIKSNLIPIKILKNYFYIYPNNLPKYFKNIPTTLPHFNLKDHTVRTCSGFLNFYTNSITFKSPCDIEIKHEDGKVTSFFGKGLLNDTKRFKLHPNEQFLDYINQEKYLFICKLSLDIFIQCKYPVFMVNSLWDFNKIDIFNGVINAKDPIDLNFFIAFPRDKKNIFIKQNDPLFHLVVLSNKKIKINFFEEKHEELEYDNFHYVFNSLKKYLLPKKYHYKDE